MNGLANCELCRRSGYDTEAACAFPDLAVVTHSAFGDDENVAAEVEIGGTQRKDFLQIPNQGRNYDLPHAFLLKVNGGLGVCRSSDVRGNLRNHSAK